MAAAALVLGPIAAQNSNLSSTSAYRPETLLRLGIVAPGPTFNFGLIEFSFKGCMGSACSFQGVPILPDLNTALTLVPLRQFDTATPVSTRTRWRYELPIPPAFPSGVPLYFQAALIDTTAGAVDVTHGIAAQTLPAGPPRGAFGTCVYYSGGWAYLYVESIDIDGGKTAVVHDANVGGPGVLMGPNSSSSVGLRPPRCTSNARYAALSFPVNNRPEQVFLFDRSTRNGTWLPLSGAAGVTGRFAGAQFQPTFNDRVWTIEGLAGGCSSSGADDHVELVATNLTALQVPFQRQRITGRCFPTFATLVDWIFDAPGQNVLVLTRNISSLSLSVDIWRSGGTTNPQAAALTPLAPIPIPASAPSSFAPKLVPVPNSSRVVVQYRDTVTLQETFVVVDCAAGVASAPYAGSPGSNAYIGTASPNGDFVTFQHANQPDVVHFIDGLASVAAAAPPVILGPPVNLPPSGRGTASVDTPFVAAFPNSVITDGLVNTPNQALSNLFLDNNRLPRIERAQPNTGCHQFYLLQHVVARPWTGLGGLSILLAVTQQPPTTGSHIWMMLDAETMTFASLGPSLGTCPGMSPAGRNIAFIF